jgi:hypothetical protein
MQLFPQGLPVLQCGAPPEVEAEGAAADAIGVAAAGVVLLAGVAGAAASVEHFTKWPVFGSLHDLASEAPAARAKAKATINIRMASLPCIDSLRLKTESRKRSHTVLKRRHAGAAARP